MKEGKKLKHSRLDIRLTATAKERLRKVAEREKTTMTALFESYIEQLLFNQTA